MGPPGLEPGTNPEGFRGCSIIFHTAYGKEGIQSGMSVVIASASSGSAKARAADRALIVGSTRRIRP